MESIDCAREVVTATFKHHTDHASTLINSKNETIIRYQI